MREILFRGRQANNKEWIYGYYAVIGARHAIIKAQPEDYYPAGGNVKESHGNGVIGIDPETVCQYTGLADKKGRKIFDNDILEFEASDGCRSNYMVFWNGTEWATRDIGLKCDDDCRDWDTSGWEVIGNIFDNPGLIKE